MWSSSRWRTPDRIRARAGLLVALLCTLALAAAAEGSSLDPSLDQVRRNLAPRLAGEARLTWFGFHIYDAQLYVPERFDARRSIAQPFVLELTYARALKGRSIAETSRDEIARLGFGDDAQRKRWFEQMAGIFPDVERGQRIAGVNVPEQGVRFYIDDREAGRIDDGEFARAFFAIWLDPRTQSPQVRAGLLRGVVHD